MSVKISELPIVNNAGELDPADKVPVVNEGITKKLSLSIIADFIASLIDKVSIGLGNVDNTSDADKPISDDTQAALDLKADLVSGKIPQSQLPSVAITNAFPVASQAAMLALTAQEGDVAIRSDLNKTFILSATPATTLGNWLELLSPTDSVTSVAGKTGTVTLVKADVGLSNVDNTADSAKPVSTAQAAADALKYDKAGGQINGNVEIVGTARRVQGDFSNATVSSRLTFQSSVANSFTSVSAIPNGSATVAEFGVNSSSSDPDNGSYGFFRVTTATDVRISSTKLGSGTYLPLTLFAGGAEGFRMETTARHITPGADNTQNFGSGALRWGTIYAGTGAINTSDGREKTEKRAFTQKEIAAARDLSENIGIYKWLSAVEKKGENKARSHVGMPVQSAISIMESHGLDPMAYGFICYDEWKSEDEIKDEDGTVVRKAIKAGNLYGFRQDELYAFIARGFAARLKALEDKASK